MITSFTRRSALILATVAIPGAARAQAFPSRPVRILVGYPAGGSVDATARALAQQLTQLLRQPFIVENRSGANGVVAMQAAAQAPPDGYTLLFGNAGMLAISNALNASLPVDSVRDFTAIAQVAALPLVIAVPGASPARSLGDLLTLARARPGALSMGTGGNGSLPHLAFELMRRQAAVDILHVPYRGSAPAVLDLVAGRLDFIIDAYNSLQGQAEAGRVRVLATTAPVRQAVLPGVPTVAEAGLEGYSVVGWQGLVAPVAMPPETLRILEAAVSEAMRRGELSASYEAQGSTAQFLDAAAFGALIRSERQLWARVVREASIRVE